MQTSGAMRREIAKLYSGRHRPTNREGVQYPRDAIAAAYIRSAELGATDCRRLSTARAYARRCAGIAMTRHGYSGAAPTGGPPGGRCRKVIVA